MVDAVLSSVVNNLRSYVVEEVSLYRKVDDDVKGLQRELGKLQRFLQDADTKQKQGNEEVNEWVRNIQDVAYDAEDVIETFMLKADNFPPVGTFMLIIRSCSTAPIESLKNICEKCILPIFTSMLNRYMVGREIRVLKARIDKISTRGHELHIAENVVLERNTANESVQEQGLSSFKKCDLTSIVGLEEDKRIIIKSLHNTEERRTVVSIVGLGGLGKTTLARKVYYSKEVKDFCVRAWVSVSQDYKISKILKCIIEQITNKQTEADLSEVELKDQLREMLRSKGRYLIVLDDVWDERFWDQIGTALPDERNRSRVIFTTRHRDIARHADPDTDPYLMPFLGEKESSELFLKKVYPNGNVRTFPNDLKVVGKQLVKKCRGLALALEVLGGLVSRKERNAHHWRLVLDTIDWNVTEAGVCLKVLGVSYYSLPRELKPCFLYIGCFPEDSNINARQLIRLWLAEGFVPRRRENSLLEELVQRSLIQVVERRWDGSAKIIRIHDLLREFCIKEAEKNEFLRSGSFDPSITLDITMTRHLALTDRNSIDSYFDSSSRKWRTPKLRTLLNFSLSEVGEPYDGLTLLRVIDMRLADPSAKLSKGIACFLHLRYLRWWGCSVVDYQLIRNLRYLQTLDVRPSIVNPDDSIGSFRYLQFLGDIEAGMWMEHGLAKLTKLQRLVIKNLDDTHWKMFVKSLENLHHLFSLSLSAKKYSTISAEVIASLKSLNVLKLDGMIDQQIYTGAFSHGLTKLTLINSNLWQDPMLTLKTLPNLVYLKLRFAYWGNRMSCDAGGFPQLQYLTLDYLPKLAELNLASGALPSLTCLTIQQCTNLKMVPNGLQHLSTLQKLKLSRMPPHFIQRFLEPGGPDCDKVRHIRSIFINY